jgi:GT2 family glycosyltransferase
VSPEPVVSVVVATHQRRQLLARLVAAVEAQQLDAPYELVVVDDASSDGTWAELERLARQSPVPLTPLRLERNAGPATARNAGWRRARAPLIAFTDDDCVPQPGWLDALVAALADAELVQGATLPAPEQVGNHGPFSRTLEVRAENGYYQTCNMGYRRELLEALGGFDERFRHPAGEDTDLAWRARERGARTAFAADAVVHHDVRPSSFTVHLRDLWRWEGVVLTLRLHPQLRSHIHRRWWLRRSHPPAVLAVAGVVAAAGGRRPWVRLAALALLVPYVRYRATVAPLRGGPRRRLAVIPLALASDLTEVGVMAIASARYRTLVL